MRLALHQTALVTGGSSGIGLEIARQLAQQGLHVWLLARRANLLAEALARVQAAAVDPGQRFSTLVADVSDAEQVHAAVVQMAEAAGAPDLLVNSAGVAQPGYFQEMPLERFHWMMAINYFGLVHMTQAVVPGMIARRAGHIVNISSVSGFLGIFGYSAYTASKFAVTGFSEVLRAELKPHGVGVSIVFPPDVDTPQLAYERQYQPPETQALAPLRGVLSPAAVAQATLRGVARNHFIILPGIDSKLSYLVSHLLGRTFHPAFDLVLAMLSKNTRRRQKPANSSFKHNP